MKKTPLLSSVPKFIGLPSASLKLLTLPALISIYSGTSLIRHTNEPGKCMELYRMLEYSGFILVNRNTLGPYIFAGCHRMSENSGVGLHKFHCIANHFLCLNTAEILSTGR
jgi:hypothetical protein